MQIWSRTPCVFLCDISSTELESMSLNTDIVYNESIWPHIMILNIYNYGPGLIKLAGKPAPGFTYEAGEVSLFQHYDSHCLKFQEKYIFVCQTLKVRKRHWNIRKMACWDFSNGTHGTAKSMYELASLYLNAFPSGKATPCWLPKRREV